MGKGVGGIQLALSACLAACSAGDGDRDARQRGDRSEAPDSAGEPAGAGRGAGDADRFGNSNSTVVSISAPNEGAPQSEGGASGPCEVGMFCEPQGPDPDHCGTLRLESDVEVTVTPGNVLVVFDQSGSMSDTWPGTGNPKLVAAQNALVQAVMSLSDLLRVGALFFPSYACVPAFPPPEGGAVSPITAPDQIDFQPAPEFLEAWDAKWTTAPASLGIGTPLQEAFDRAQVAIDNAQLDGELAVVVFTDGEPNCFNDPAFSGVDTALETERASAWLDAGIKTYVVGLPGADGVQVLDDIAQAGGTSEYIVPDDPATLEEQLRTIVEETVKTGFESCSIELTPAAEVPDELLMIVEEEGVGTQQVPRDRGWTLSDDGAHVEITGTLCDAAKGGRFSSITFEYACPDVPPPPALPPVE